MTRKIFIQKEPFKPVSLLIKELEETEIENLRELSEEELVSLFDAGLKLKSTMDDAKAKYELVRAAILKNAKEHGWKEKEGTECVVKISSSTTSTMSPRDLAKVLKELKKTELLDSLISVRIGDCKKYLGEVFLEPYMEVKSEEYGTVSIKPKKK